MRGAKFKCKCGNIEVIPMMPRIPGMAPTTSCCSECGEELNPNDCINKNVQYEI